MDPDALAAELDKPLAGQLLRATPLARLAYTAADGTPRVVPVGFLWKDRRVQIFTPAGAAKVGALQRNPAVALTVDTDGLPPRALLLRGIAHVTIEDGVPADYIDASLKTQSTRGAGAESFAAGCRSLYDSMARIAIEPTWARLNDFETSLPKHVEELIAAKR